MSHGHFTAPSVLLLVHTTPTLKAFDIVSVLETAGHDMIMSDSQLHCLSIEISSLYSNPTKAARVPVYEWGTETPRTCGMQDAAAWLFPSTEGSRAAALLQPQFKPKQLTQRFNHFFWRKKPKQASSEEGVSQPDNDGMLGEEEDRVREQQSGLAQEQGQGLDALGQQSRADARSSPRLLPKTGQAGTPPQQQLPSSPMSGTGLPQTGPVTGPKESVQQAAAAQAESMPDFKMPRGQTPPLKEGFSAPVPSQRSMALRGLPQSPLPQASSSVPKASSSLLRIAQVPYQQAYPFQAAAQLPYHPSSSAIMSPTLPSDLHTLPSQDLQQGLRPLPYSPGPKGIPTPDKEEEQHSRGPWRAPALPAFQPLFESDALTAPLFRHKSSGQMEQPVGPALPTGQTLWEGDLPIKGQAQQEEHYEPGMYDGFATMPSQLPDRHQQQQQQATWQQAYEQQRLPQQLPQQHQQRLTYAADRDHIIDMGGSAQSHLASLSVAQRAQHPQRSMSGISQEAHQAVAYPELTQHVPFYESSPQYIPSTLTAKSPVRTAALSKVTGFLGFPKQQTHPKDLEAGADPRANSPISAQAPYDPSPPSGCSPKSALLRSGIFQNPKTPDQDKPLSPEQAERRARGLVRTRVEPKVFFANERTFLQWLQISVLLMFTGLSLLGGSSVGGSKGGSSGDSSTTCASNDTACKASKVSSCSFPFHGLHLPDSNLSKEFPAIAHQAVCCKLPLLCHLPAALGSSTHNCKLSRLAGCVCSCIRIAQPLVMTCHIDTQLLQHCQVHAMFCLCKPCIA